MTTLYAVSVSDNPRIPIGTIIGMKGHARIWIGATQKPDGSMGDLTAIRHDLMCVRCWQADKAVKFNDHDCPNAPEAVEPDPPGPWTPHPDQLDMLEGLLR